MIFEETELKGSFLVTMQPKMDDRGWFSRFYCKEEFAGIGHVDDWVQMNHSFTKQAGTIRGMHFQKGLYSEIKLVKCVAGMIFDVIIDLRPNSPSYKRYYGVQLSSDGPHMIYIPRGFAHGFQTLTDRVELVYLHSQAYTPSAEEGIRYDDPAFAIKWPMKPINISERDLSHPLYLP